MMDAKQIAGELRGSVVLDHYGVKFTTRGDELRTRQCGACGQRSRDAVSINVATGKWCCHRCGEKGDLLRLVALFSGLDVAREFPRVVELAAQIAGIDASAPDPEIERGRAERRKADEERRARARAEANAVRAAMSSRWAALSTTHPSGERYLAGRGLDPRELRRAGDVVRYSPSGDPAVALRDLETGAIVGMQYRRLTGEPKIIAERGSQLAGSALLGRSSDIDPEGADVAVIVEGLADTLAAVLAFPGCAVFGAPGAGQMARIAAAVAPRVRVARGWLLLLADNDETGTDNASDAIAEVVRAGLQLAHEGAGIDGASTVRLVDIGAHHDLADAYAAGWRNPWPQVRT